jgi:hypothetical protein
LVFDMVDSIESVSGISNILEAVIETSMISVWREMEGNADIKTNIKKKLMEEEEEEKFLLESQSRAERRMRQEVAKRKWLSSQEEKDMNVLAARLTNMAVSNEPEGL